MSMIAHCEADKDEGYRYFSLERIVELLVKAQALGFDMEAGSDLERLTIEELEKLVEGKPQ